MRVYRGDTTELLTVYKDSAFETRHADPMQADAWGRLPEFYIEPDGKPYRLEIHYPHPYGTVKTYHGVADEPNTAAAKPYHAPALPLQELTKASVELKPADFGTVVHVKGTGTQTPVVLPNASAVEAGAVIAIRNAGDAGVLRIQAQSIDLIDDKSTLVLTNADEIVGLAATGKGYVTLFRSAPRSGVQTVLTRGETTLPATAPAGATYLAPINADAPYAADSIYIADGLGGYTERRPQSGDMAIVLDEDDGSQIKRFGSTTETSTSLSISNTLGLFRSMPVSGPGIPSGATITEVVENTSVTLSDAATATATNKEYVFGFAGPELPAILIYTAKGWVALTDYLAGLVASAAESIFAAVQRDQSQTMTVRAEFADATTSKVAFGGENPTANAWTDDVLNTEVDNSIENASLENNRVTLPRGRYNIRAYRTFFESGKTAIRFRSDLKTVTGPTVILDTGIQGQALIDQTCDLTAQSEFVLQFHVQGSVTDTTLGDVNGRGGEPEIYAQVVITKLSEL